MYTNSKALFCKASALAAAKPVVIQTSEIDAVAADVEEDDDREEEVGVEEEEELEFDGGNVDATLRR